MTQHEESKCPMENEGEVQIDRGVLYALFHKFIWWR